MPNIIAKLVLDLLIILLAGLTAGIVCKRFGISVLVGYLVVGAFLGHGGVGLIDSTSQSADYELDYLAQSGALFLLFSIGLEFSLHELVRIGRFFFVGGSLQMVLVAVPVTVSARLCGMPWQAAALIGAATALSSTVLVYKALEEFGQAETPHGRRAIAILLFQDAALIPLMLIVPMLTGAGRGPSPYDALLLAAKTVLFVAIVLGLRMVVGRVLIPLLAGLRSTELVVLFALTVLGAAGIGAYSFRLPPALGAFAAGLIFSDNRLTAQIDALVLPYRETFAAVFFVSLGTLMRFDIVIAHSWLCLAGLATVLVLKAATATVALRAVGLPWRASGGMALGLAEMGEFSFLLLSAGASAGVIPRQWFSLALFVALGTLILAPLLIKTGLRWTDSEIDGEQETAAVPTQPMRRAAVVGMGPIGAQVASRLETVGIAVRLIDLSPVNLHPYAQEGFHTVAGDATDPAVLRRAAVGQCALVVVTVPKDQAAKQIVAAVRKLNRDGRILVRCRFRASASALKQAGADAVVSEESEASAGLLRLLEGVSGGA